MTYALLRMAWTSHVLCKRFELRSVKLKPHLKYWSLQGHPQNQQRNVVANNIGWQTFIEAESEGAGIDEVIVLLIRK